MQGVEAALHRAHSPGTRAVVRKVGIDALERQAELLRAGLKVAALAGQVVPGIAMAGIGNFWADQRIGRRNQFSPVADRPAPVIVSKRVNVWDGPVGRRGRRGGSGASRRS